MIAVQRIFCKNVEREMKHSQDICIPWKIDANRNRGNIQDAV